MSHDLLKAFPVKFVKFVRAPLLEPPWILFTFLDFFVASLWMFPDSTLLFTLIGLSARRFESTDFVKTTSRVFGWNWYDITPKFLGKCLDDCFSRKFEKGVEVRRCISYEYFRTISWTTPHCFSTPSWVCFCFLLKICPTYF